MNIITLVGNIVKDVSTVKADNETLVMRNTIAVAKENKSKGADFFDFVAFNKTAEFLGNYAKKGNKIAICGRLTTSDFVRKDGSKGKAYSILVDRAELLSPKNEEETVESKVDNEEEESLNNDNLPF